MSDARAILDPRDDRAAVRRALHHWLALQNHAALRPMDAREALDKTGAPEAALRALKADSGTLAPERDITAQLAALARIGALGVPFGSPAYPACVATLPDAAPLLWVRGNPALLGRRAVAIVGARAATAYGRTAARRLARELAALGFAIVSGLARGIDAEAHRGALEAGGPTLAVLGSGVDVVYPRGHGALAAAVAERGALLSELPPGTPPRRYHFPLRNRLISALAAAVIVVEARERSGSLITAQHGLEQGREVLAVPGPVDAPTSVGPNLLLRAGAPPALDAGDVLRALGLPLRACKPHAVLAAPASSPEAHEILRALAREPATRDELARRLGRSAHTLARELLSLELEGRVVEDRDGRLRSVTPLATA